MAQAAAHTPLPHAFLHQCFDESRSAFQSANVRSWPHVQLQIERLRVSEHPKLPVRPRGIRHAMGSSCGSLMNFGATIAADELMMSAQAQLIKVDLGGWGRQSATR
jgi:hypothetical protein